MPAEDVSPKPLAGRRIALTGHFASMPQAQFAELIRELGGVVVASPSRRTQALVVGEDGWPLSDDGRTTQSLETARRIGAYGYQLEILQEEEFLLRYGLAELQHSIRRRYTINTLSRLLNVPGQKIRAWVRYGLIEPTEIEHRLAYFDYRQVASAKRLEELLAAGAPIGRVRQSLERLQAWWPQTRVSLVQLAALEDRGSLLVRLSNGRLADAEGQLRLDFETDESQQLALTTKTADEWFCEALEHEDAGRLKDACYAYQSAVELDPCDPVLRFNLGNVMYQLDRKSEAAELYAQATERDPLYAESWNNLGSVLAELGKYDEGATSLRRAVGLIPSYADAHYNLAETLYEVGNADDAVRHWRAFLEHAPASAWAEEVRQRIRQSRSVE
jgi:tetratricopeptide (TPR) repeat protein